MEASKISVKPLSGKSDWQIWKYRIKFALNYHSNALEVVEGKLTKPETPEEGASDAIQKVYRDKLQDFNKANNCAMMILTNSMTEEMLQKVMRFDKARDIWLELHKLFEDSSDNQLYNICLQFFKVTWSGAPDMAAHLSKLKNLWNELNNGLESKGEKQLPEMLLICKILDTLPPNYRNFKSSWLLLSDEKRTLDELTTQLCTHERELKKDSKYMDEFDQEALIANSEVKRKTDASKKNYSKCNYCHQKGHWVRTCRKWIADGKPPKQVSHTVPSKEKKNNLAVNMALLAEDEEIYCAEANSNDWYIDNGSSRHIVNNDRYFSSFEKFELPHSITVANGNSLEAIGKGTIKVVTTVNGRNQIKNLENVWYVPEISKNLFSVLATQDKNQNSIFQSTFKDCYLKIDGETVLHGTRNAGGGLFKARMKSLTPETRKEANVTENNESILQLYHERWGHQDKQHIKSLLENEFNIKVKIDKILCEPCVYGKAHRLKFGNRKKATQPGELIFTDICGPFEKSFRGYRYFALFKDAYTKFRYCYFLKKKSEIKDVLEHFIGHAENLGHNIREIISDNGGEFNNPTVLNILNKHGITQRLTAPYTPEQNGGCERENRTVVEMARTLKYSNKEVDFPAYLWAEFICTSIYILNRTSKSSVPNASPYELWMGRKPRVKHMRIIGSVCYAHVPVQKRRKFDRKAIKGYHIGYDGEERYRIYVRETGKVICSRDVTFEEKLSSAENLVTYPSAQLSGKDTDEEDPVMRPEFPNQGEEEVENEKTRQKEERPKRQILTPRWTKDYIMGDTEEYEEIPDVNKVSSTS